MQVADELGYFISIQRTIQTNSTRILTKSISENRTDSQSQDQEIGRFLVSLSTDRMEVPNRSGIQKGWDRTDRNPQFIGSVRIGNRFWTDRMPALRKFIANFSRIALPLPDATQNAS